MARLMTHGGLLAGALVLQLTVLDTLPFPGAVTPDLVLLVVVAIAVTSGPLPGLVSGFCGGLAMDLAPPAVHAIGAYGLAFCLTGYVCGRAAGEIERSAIVPLAAMALGALTGSLLYTVVGVMFGEADITWAAARHVLPLSITYDVLLSPFVLYLVLRLLRWAGQAAEDPAAAVARAAGASRAAGAQRRPAAARELKIRQGTTGSAGWVGAAPPSRELAANAWSSGNGGAATGRGWARTLQEAPPRMRFGSSARPAASPPGRPGVFSGGSLVGGSPVRLRLRTSRGPGLAARLGQVLGLAPRGRQPAQPRFGSAPSALTGLAPRGRQAAHPRFGSARSTLTRPASARVAKMPRFDRRRSALARPAMARRRGRSGLTALWPRKWGPNVWRSGGRRTGGFR